MGFIDWVLNIIGLLLWLSFWASRFDPLSKPAAGTLAGTLKPAEPRKTTHANALIWLTLLLVARAVFYDLIGRSLEIPFQLDPGTVTMIFRPLATPSFDSFLHMLSYSLASFILTFTWAHLWLVFLAAINHREGDHLIYLRLLRFYLGRLARSHPAIQLLLGLILVGLAWALIRPLMIWQGTLPPSKSTLNVLAQIGLIMVSSLISLRYLIAILLGLHFLSQFAYFGQPPWLLFVITSAKNLLAPFANLPLRIGQVDFMPILIIAATFGIAQLIRHYMPTLLTF